MSMHGPLLEFREASPLTALNTTLLTTHTPVRSPVEHCPILKAALPPLILKFEILMGMVVADSQMPGSPPVLPTPPGLSGKTVTAWGFGMPCVFGTPTILTPI